jgi:hypothetical protein
MTDINTSQNGRTSRAGQLAVAFQISLPTVALALSFPLLFGRRLDTTVQGTVEVDRLWLILAYGFLFSLVVAARYGSAIRHLNLQQTLFLGFVLSCVVGSIASQSVVAMFNTGALATVAFLIGSSLPGARQKSSFATVSVVFCSFLVAAVVIHRPEGRWLGGIHPNIIGTIVFGASFFSLFFRKSLWTDVTCAISVSVGILVSSRYSVMSVGIMYILYIAMSWDTVTRLRRVVLLAVGLVAVCWLFYDQFRLVDEVFLLSDPNRGIYSGVSGRSYLTAKFLEQFEGGMWLGFGFRNRAAYINPHNGFLTVLLETGLIGGALFYGSTIARVYEVWKRWRSESGEARAFMAALLAGFAGASVTALFQPQLLSFGDAFGFTVLVLMFARLPEISPLVRHDENTSPH